MRLSDILVCLNIDGKLLPFVLDCVPGISREESIEFLFKLRSDDIERAIRCYGPLTSDECSILKSFPVMGIMIYNNNPYKMLQCRLSGFGESDVLPRYIAVISKIPSRKYDYFVNFSIVIKGNLFRIKSINDFES